MLLTDSEISIIKNRYNLYEEQTWGNLIGCERKVFYYKDQHTKLQLFSVTRSICSKHSCWKLDEFAVFSDLEKFRDYKVIENPNVYSFTDLNLRVMELVNKLALYQKTKLLTRMKQSMESDFNE
jgi:hypothetical protein